MGWILEAALALFREVDTTNMPSAEAVWLRQMCQLVLGDELEEREQAAALLSLKRDAFQWPGGTGERHAMKRRIC